MNLGLIVYIITVQYILSLLSLIRVDVFKVDFNNTLFVCV